jgi:lysophospholipase L1-like esterase
MTTLGTAWKLVRPPLAASGILAGQMLHAIRRSDLPYLPDQDPSGVFGHRDAPPLRIVVMGDSSVTAPGVVPLDDCWARRVAIHLGPDHRVELISVARGGSRVEDVLDGQLEQAVAAEPDLAWVAVGSNDALRGTSVARFEEEYTEIVSRLVSVVPVVGCSGIGDLGTIPRLPALAQGVARVRGRSFDNAVARVAAGHDRVRKSVAWGPQWAEFETDITTFADDLFHASAKGHGMFAERGVIPVIDELMAIRSGTHVPPART